MTDRPLYGRRRIDRMLAEWNAHRAAVASGDIERIQATFDACEEWVGFAFGESSDGSGVAQIEREHARKEG